MTRAGEREIVKAEHANGGAGYILKEALLTGEDLGQHCRSSVSPAYQGEQLGLINDRDPQVPGLAQLGAGGLAGHHAAGLFGHGAGHFSPQGL